MLGRRNGRSCYIPCGIQRRNRVSLQLLFLSIDIATIVCNALLLVRLMTSNPRLRSAQLIALIAFNSSCHIILGRQDYGYWIPAAYRFDVGDLATFLNFARNLTPGLFMILCFELFSESRRFPRWLLALFAFQMFLEVPVRWLIPNGWPFFFDATQVVPATLETLFAVAALYWTVTDWRTDLVEARRAVRAVTLFVISLNIVIASLFQRVLIDPNTIANYYTHEALIASSLGIVAFLLLALSGSDIGRHLDPAHAAPPLATRPADPETVAALSRLANLLEVDHVYRRPSLTLGDLADLVQLPEYRLRKLINEELGYQNFNAFLHAYRIREACQLLRDPAQRRVPILTIALSVGYQSVNTFNRGFRDILGMTPSAYRALDDAPVPVALRKIAPESA